tara:strand:- start:150 stop:962 length:813 start_codon:yes stop_codon:yes gene_type:complete
MKFNKKRNTAFLYECLLKELTKSIVRKENKKKEIILNIIKESFHKGSPLKEELEVYRSVLESKKLPKVFAQKFLSETKIDFDKLDRKAIFNQQTALIKRINETLTPEAFANFISNYKDINSLGAYFGSKLKAKNRLLIESRLVDILTKDKKEVKEMKHIDNLAYSTFVKKFNDTYGKTLRQEQKDLLMNYIVSFSDNGLGLKSFLNEEILRLKKEVGHCTKKPKISENKAFTAKAKRVLKQLDSYSKREITENIVKEVFYIQDLVNEVNS